MKPLVWLATACCIVALNAATAAPLAGDTPLTTATGNLLTAPTAWESHIAPKTVRLDAPEGDLHIAVVDVADASDAKTAVAAAWAIYSPGDKHALKMVTPRAARNGWDERAVADYETSPNEHLALQAIALRKGKSWTVLILNGSESTAEKRGGAINLVLQSLRPAGYTKESFAAKTAHKLDAARVEAMRSFVEAAIKDLGVPGASFALIEHGKVVYEGGVGVRELGKPETVDAQTLFMVASNTKGMSTLLLSELVDEGKLAWDDPVTKVYPSFRLGSDKTTRSVLVKHLVCACTGLPRKDYDWIFNTPRGTPATTTFTQLAATEPTSGFGEVFQYNNLMATAAGYIGGYLVHPDKEIGAAYDAAMQEKIFTPLGMADTTFSMPKALASNHASPHGDDIDGKPSVAQMDFNYAIMPYRPAGGAWSSAHDLIKYVALELTKGALPDGKRLVSEENLLARRVHNVPIGEAEWYGMGLMDDQTFGVSVVHHGGSMAGYKSDIIAIPGADVGAVILANSDTGQMLLRPFRRRLLEVLYDGNPEAAADVAAAAAANRAAIATERPKLVVPADPVAANALAAVYASRELGRLRVQKTPKGVRFEFMDWGSEVATRKNDDGTLSFVTTAPAVDGLAFTVDAKDGKRMLTLRDGQHAYVFTEVEK